MGVALRGTAALVLAASLAACDLLGGPPGDPGFEPVGPVVVLAEGRDGDVAWRYEVQRTADGYCEMVVAGPRRGSGGCIAGEAELAPGAANLGESSGTDMPTYVHGRAGDAVEAIRITTRHDGEFEGQVFEAPAKLGLGGRFFIVVLPEMSTVLSATTFDGDGEVLEVIQTGLAP